MITFVEMICSCLTIINKWRRWINKCKVGLLVSQMWNTSMASVQFSAAQILYFLLIKNIETALRFVHMFSSCRSKCARFDSDTHFLKRLKFTINQSNVCFPFYNLFWLAVIWKHKVQIHNSYFYISWCSLFLFRINILFDLIMLYIR